MTFDISGMRIRPATPDDALCVGVLGTQVFLDTYATDGIRPGIAREVLSAFSTAACAALLAEPDTRSLLAEYENHLIGFAQIALWAGHDLAPVGIQAELFRLYVQEPFTAQGVGGALLQSAEALLREHGASVVWLKSWVHNVRARAFYAKRGYTDCGRTLYTFEGEAHENRLLAKAL